MAATKTKTITLAVAESRVTDLRLEGERLYVAGVDVDEQGASVRGHSKSFADTELPPAVRKAVKTVRDYAAKWVDEQ